MTQSDLAQKLNVTRQAVSQYELGDTFPDVYILVIIADIFNITLDELINYGEPTKVEANILEKAALGSDNLTTNNIEDIINIAPLLKPSLLDKLSSRLATNGLDISNIVVLSEFLNEETTLKLIENTKLNNIDYKLLEKIIPMLGSDSKEKMFEKIIEGGIDWHFLEIVFPNAKYLWSQMEDAVIEGVLPW